MSEHNRPFSFEKFYLHTNEQNCSEDVHAKLLQVGSFEKGYRAGWTDLESSRLGKDMRIHEDVGRLLASIREERASSEISLRKDMVLAFMDSIRCLLEGHALSFLVPLVDGAVKARASSENSCVSYIKVSRETFENFFSCSSRIEGLQVQVCEAVPDCVVEMDTTEGIDSYEYDFNLLVSEMSEVASQIVDSYFSHNYGTDKIE
ncbi:hypothetical protein [Poseidonocella sp. HB161398]|uniref:hypothetical protein n=1 Tax=Poseidonocella sp. HB161398 TaxID=2320855 RepID=UPI001108B947|nr:hypothetical protein [Poseidonocella sp. HB161398]